MKEVSKKEFLEKELLKLYPDAESELNFKNNYELLTAVVLSAHCTDAIVNKTTPLLFKTAPDFKALASLEFAEIEEIIKPCGLYKNKAKYLKNLSNEILQKHGGKVPKTFDELTLLPGVGRKTANVILNIAFNLPAVAVDTHVFRVTNRLGIAKSKTPLECESKLMKFFDRDMWSSLNLKLVLFGRRICKARKPECGICPLNSVCEYYKKWKMES